MKRNISIFITYILVFFITFSNSNVVNVFADEPDIPDISETEDIPVEEDPYTITSIEPYDTELLELEYKPALDSLLRELPETITVFRGEDSEVLEVTWECQEDYNDYLGEYHFLPVLEDYTLSPELAVPVITVIIDKDDTDSPGGAIEYDLGFEVPFAATDRRRSLSGSSELGRKYNAYDDGTLPQNLPEVRNQNPYGTCWAFSVLGSAEADLIHDGNNGDTDLAELHLAYFISHDYNDPKGCRNDRTDFRATYSYLKNGGHPHPTARLLSNLVGAVHERDAEYSEATSYSPGDEDVVSKDFVRLDNVYEINVFDRDGIKSAIRDHGSVTALYYDNASGYNATYNSYCYDERSYNHAVMLVGWDDDFSRDHFNTKPDEDGAWLVRNSWGQNGYGRSGYFWLSYCDPGFLSSKEVLAIDASLDVFDNCYSYDGQPLDDCCITKPSGTVITQEYSLNAGETIKAVGFETGSADLTAEVTVTNLKTNESETTSLTTTYAGFYTAYVPELDIPTGANVSVTVQYTSNDGKDIMILCEKTGTIGPWGGITYTGVCDKGCLINGEEYNYDARLKLYTQNSNVAVSENIKLAETDYSGHAGETSQIMFAEDSTIKSASLISWESTNTKYATVDDDGMITFGCYKGFARIRGTYTDNEGHTETVYCTATVKPYDIIYHITDDTLTEGMTGNYAPSSGTINGVFYPGDVNNSELFHAVRTSGYYVADWYTDSGLDASSTLAWKPDVYEDLELWPKWEEMHLAVRYHTPYSDFSGYDRYMTDTITEDIPATGLPYILPGADGCADDPDEWAEYYNAGDYPTTKSFSYWSSDANGKNKVTSVTTDALDIRYSGGKYKYRNEVILYPQYKDSTKTIYVTGVELNAKSISLARKKNYRLIATVTPSTANNKGVTWSTSNSKVATVTSTGYVKAVKKGTAVITVKTLDGGKTATCKVKVTEPVTGVSINKTKKTIVGGKGYQLKAKVKPSNASNKKIKWSSSNTKVATVTSNGYVKAVKKGTAVITATTIDGKRKATCKIKVTEPVKRVSLNKKFLVIGIRGEYQLKAKIAPSNASNKRLTWESSDTGVVTVTSTGYVEAVRPGSAEITVETADGGKTATCNVLVVGWR